MDAGMYIELALRDAVDKKKDFDRFADMVRHVAFNLELSDTERDKIFGALAKEILDWKSGDNQ